MKKRILAAALAGGAIGVLAPGIYASAHAATVPPECVVVHGPGGATVQVGYAPNGPSDCHQVG
jgi:hypothetical protein